LFDEEDFRRAIEGLREKLPGQWPIWDVEIRVRQERARIHNIWNFKDATNLTVASTRVYNGKDDIIYQPSHNQASIYAGIFGLEIHTIDFMLFTSFEPPTDASNLKLTSNRKRGSKLEIEYGSKRLSVDESNGFISRLATVSDKGLVAETLRLLPTQHNEKLTLPAVIVEITYQRTGSVHLLSIYHLTGLQVNPELPFDMFKMKLPKNTKIADMREDPSNPLISVCPTPLDDVIPFADDYREKARAYKSRMGIGPGSKQH
jgi:hypothetical protein